MAELKRDPSSIFVVVVCVVGAIAFLVGAYFYSKQQEDCDKAGGVLARNGVGYICVQEMK